HNPALNNTTHPHAPPTVNTPVGHHYTHDSHPQQAYIRISKLIASPANQIKTPNHVRRPQTTRHGGRPLPRRGRAAARTPRRGRGRVRGPTTTSHRGGEAARLVSSISIRHHRIPLLVASELR